MRSQPFLAHSFVRLENPDADFSTARDQAAGASGCNMAGEHHRKKRKRKG
jgi:hypothetical protein